MSEITISSTTDSQEQVEAALDADEATGYQETPSNDERSSTIITSTTDTAAELDEAMYGPDEPHARNGSIVQPIERPSRVASTTDPPEEVERVAAELKEDQEQRPDYLGRPRRAEKRIAQLVREREEYRARSEALSAELQNRQQQPPPQQPQPDLWQRAHARQYSPQEQQSAVEAYRAAQARIAEEEKVFVERHPDYIESVRRLEPGHESPIPPTSYYHLMLNIPNAPDVGYYLSRHPETIAKLWSWKRVAKALRSWKS